MSDTSSTPAARRKWIIAAAIAIAVAVVIVGAVIAFLVIPRASDSTADPSPSASSSRSATGSPSPTATGAAPEPSSPSSPSVGEDGRETQAPVPLDGDASPEDGVTVRVAGLEAVDGEGAGPAETSGPAIRVTVEVANSGTSDLSLASAVVNAFYGAGVPAGQLSRPGGVAFPATVAPGTAATGVFIFVIPTDERSDVVISVDLAVRAPIVVFQGPVP